LHLWLFMLFVTFYNNSCSQKAFYCILERLKLLLLKYYKIRRQKCLLNRFLLLFTPRLVNSSHSHHLCEILWRILLSSRHLKILHYSSSYYAKCIKSFLKIPNLVFLACTYTFLVPCAVVKRVRLRLGFWVKAF